MICVRQLAVAVLLAAAVTIPSAAAGTATGLSGTVRRGPIQPVCVEGEPCDAAAPGVRLAIWRSGAVVAVVRTSARGTFRVPLRPGVYVVRLTARPAVGGLAPVTVRVRPTGFTRVALEIDTGIR